MGEIPEQKSQTESNDFVSFILATICTLPFVGGIGLYALFLLSHNERFLNYLFIACMFWPVLAALAVGGTILILTSWFKSPAPCRPFLICYVIAISGFLLLGFLMITQIGP